MRSVYFLAPDIATTKSVVDKLLLARVDERHIHVVAKPGLPLEDLPEASFLQKSDFIPALQQGVALGAETGLLAGLVAVMLPTGLVLGGGAVLAIGLAGAGLGGLMSSMIGIDIGSRRIEQFQAAIETGSYLLIVDIPGDRAEEIEQLIMVHDPTAEYEGVNTHTFP